MQKCKKCEKDIDEKALFYKENDDIYCYVCAYYSMGLVCLTDGCNNQKKQYKDFCSEECRKTNKVI